MLYRRQTSPGTPRRVVVTGAGIVTGIGLGWRSNADGFRDGRSAFRPVTLFPVTQQRARQAAEADLPSRDTIGDLPSHSYRKTDRAAQLLLLAAEEAWLQCEWTAGGSLPMMLGTTSGGMNLGEAYLKQAIDHPRQRQGQPSRVVYYQAHNQARLVQEAFGFSGPVTLVANACASGANAIGLAWQQIRSGQSDRVLCGGYDGLCQLVFAGFDSLQALTTGICRPFDANRDGLGLGEGAAVLALESLDSAKERGASILGEVAGYGAATDVHHLTQPHPEGNAARASMQAACETAGIQPAEVDYINAHGTGTPLNDAAEAAAINQWAGGAVEGLQVSSTKASIGHLLGAAGAVEAVICLMSLQEEWLPPGCTTDTPDPACRFSLVRQPTDRRSDIILTNSFGFGGANASLVLRRCT